MKFPFRMIGLTGRFGSGKTLALLDFMLMAQEMGAKKEGLLYLDTEGSAEPYLYNEPYSGLKMTYVDATEPGVTSSWIRALGGEILEKPPAELQPHYDVIAIDTVDIGQEEISDLVWEDPGISDNMKEKSGPLVWGRVKKKIYKPFLIMKSRRTDVLLVAAHTRGEFVAGKATGRKEGKFMEPLWKLADVIGFLERRPNTRLPDVVFDPPRGKSRILGLPPKISDFSWKKFLEYIGKPPADWKSLKKEEMVQEAQGVLELMAKIASTKEEEGETE